MKKKISSIFIFLLVCLSTFHLIFALKTNIFFSLDDFAVLSYLQNHTAFEMVIQFLSRGDIWGFKKILGYLNFSLLFKTFGTNPTAFIINNYLLHTANVILVFLISRYLTKDSLKSFFVAVFSNSLYLFYFSNIHEYLVTSLILLSIYVYLKFPKKIYYALLLFILALLTKEIALTLPFMLLSLNIFLHKKTNLRPFFIILTFFLFYQFFVGPAKINLPPSHPYATKLSFEVIQTNLKFYLPVWFLILSFSAPFILKKTNTLPFFLISFLSLLPALPLANRQETYYLYLPIFYFAIYLSVLLPRVSLKTSPVYLLVFFLLGGRKILPLVARQNFPNWQKVSIQNVTTKVEQNLQFDRETQKIDLQDIHLERDARLMLGSNTLNLFLSPQTASQYQFKYNSAQQTIFVSKK